MVENKEQIVKELIKIGCVKHGEFTLKSGKKSNTYLDLRKLISYPHLQSRICGLLSEYDMETDLICGVPYGGIPIATILSSFNHTPMIIVRKEQKDYGTKKIIEGDFKENDTVILIEDVITTGQSVMEVIQQLEKHKLIVQRIITIVDRQDGGVESLIKNGYDVKSLFLLDDFNKNTKRTFPVKSDNKTGQILLDIANTKKTNLIVSLDLTKSNDILEFVKKYSKYLCAIKIHCDIIDDFSHSFISELKNLSIKNDFLIIEDRKFADIGNTQLLQISSGIFKIVEWADIITIHLISGKSSLIAYDKWDYDNKPSLLPIVQMSTYDSLTDYNYNSCCEQIMYGFKDVVGFVARGMSINGLKFTPGISLNSKTDNKGQGYITPELAMENFESNFLIVGRDIYESNDVTSILENYLTVIKKNIIFSTD